MEHKFGNHLDLSFLKRDDSSSDPDSDFESYLSRKVDECSRIETKPLSQMDELEILESFQVAEQGKSKEQKPASVVKGTSSSDTKSAKTVSTAPSSSSSAPSAVGSIPESKPEDKSNLPESVETKYAIRGVEGHKYVTEHTEPVTLDEEWIRIRNESRKLAVTDMKPEQVIQRLHDLDRQVFLIRAQQSGLNDAIEELLKSENYQRRVELVEFRSKLTSKSKKQHVEKPSKAKSSSKGKSKVQAMADKLYNLKFTKDKIIETLQSMQLLDPVSQAYIEQLFIGSK